jgi:AraC-like DNA-binding protein
MLLEPDSLMLAEKSMSLRLLTFSWIDCQKCYHYPPHEHKFYELVIPRAKTYRCQVNGVELNLNPGEVLFLQPPDLHEDFYCLDSEIIFMSFGIYDSSNHLWNPKIIDESHPPESRRIKLEPGSATEQLIGLLEKQQRQSLGETLGLCSLAEALFWQVVTSIPEKNLSSQFVSGQEHSMFMRVVFDFFEHNLQKKLDVMQLASELQMSKRNLEYKFRKIFNFSPVETFNAYKIQLAARMIAQGNRVKDTAEYFGYSDQFYFSTVFKRVMGCSPLQWMKNRQEKSDLR